MCVLYVLHGGGKTSEQEGGREGGREGEEEEGEGREGKHIGEPPETSVVT